MFYYFDACPLAVQCSDASWKKAKVWGWTPEEAKARLVRHLQVVFVCLSGFGKSVTSNEHYTSQDSTDSISSIVPFAPGFVYNRHKFKVCSAPKSTTPQKIQVSSLHPCDKTRAVSLAESAPMLQAVADEDFEQDEVAEPTGGQVAKRLRSAPRTPTFSPPEVIQPGASGYVEMTRGQFESICDSVQRAYNATRHAQRLSAAASAAFTSEAEVLLEAKATLDAIKATIR